MKADQLAAATPRICLYLLGTFRVEREKLAALLWGDSPDEQARGSLCKALTLLRTHLGDDIVLADRETIPINPNCLLWVDALEFSAQAGEQAFDLSVQVRRTPNPFEHKLLAHQRPYFVESCRSLIAEGHYREAMPYITAFYHSACQVILSDGPEEAKPVYAARLAQTLREMGMETEAQCKATIAPARRWHEACFTLARHIADVHPGIVD